MSKKIFIQNKRSFDTISTKQYTLVLIEQKYAHDILATCTLEVCEWFSNPIHQNIEKIQQQINNRENEYHKRAGLNVAILDNEGNFMGDVEVRDVDTGKLSIGIWLGFKFHKKGTGTKVITSLLKWIDTSLKYDCIKRECYKDNTGSVSIVQSIGAKLHEIKEKNHRKYGKIKHCVYHIYPQNITIK